MIIGITGTIGAGKGTLVNFLKGRGFVHYSVRGFLIEEIKRRNLEINRESMVEVANDLRQRFSPSYIVEELYKKASFENKNIVIESLRTPGEIESLKNKEDFYLFAVDAEPFLRYERIIRRGSETDKINYADFLSQESREMNSEDSAKQNLKKCIEMADFKFENNGSQEEFGLKVFNILEKISDKKPSQKIVFGRKDYLAWDEYFMGIAILSSKRSKDPSTQVGACIVDEDKKIVATGYNGAPRGIEDKDFPWSREGDFLETKYAYVCHAELNAILNSTRENLKGCTIYVALFPCNECAKAIIQSGIKKVVYLSDKYNEIPSYIASRKMFEKVGIELVELKVNVKEINLNFKIE